MIAVIRAYKYIVSPLLPKSCRFHPSCSDYGIEAIKRHGALGGGWLAFRRLIKCHPWHKGNWHDPVP